MLGILSRSNNPKLCWFDWRNRRFLDFPLDYAQDDSFFRRPIRFIQEPEHFDRQSIRVFGRPTRAGFENP